MYQQFGNTVGFMDLTGSQAEGYVSRGLQELIAYYSNRLSYEEVQSLVERISGAEILSSQGIWNSVQQSVQRLSDQVEAELKSTLDEASPALKIQLSEQMDLYDSTSAEILLLDDGILVKAQKEKREKPASTLTGGMLAGVEREKVNVLSDVILLQKKPGQFEYIFPPLNLDGTFRLSLEEMTRKRISYYYRSWEAPLPLVVISDGAKGI